MSTINNTDFRGLFTKYMVQTLDIKPMTTDFLKSFFKTKIAQTKEVGIEVRRHSENIAVDIQRGTGGTFNRFDTSTEKIWIPPYFEEYLILNELDGYDRVFANPQETSADQFAALVNMAAEKVMLLEDKIKRKYELMCSQVLQTGIVTLNASTNIDFRRQATSKPTLANGSRWTDTGVDPGTTLQDAAKFIRTQGLAGGSTFNVIFGAKAWDAYRTNALVRTEADNRRINLQDINSPIQFGNGSDFLGRTSHGTYNFNLWGYQRFYNPAGTDKTGKVPYIDDNMIIVLPDDLVMNFAYAAVPRVQRDMMNAEFPEYIKYMPGDYVIDNYMDRRNKAHIIEVASAGLPIPTQVDAIYSAAVVAP